MQESPYAPWRGGEKSLEGDPEGWSVARRHWLEMTDENWDGRHCWQDRTLCSNQLWGLEKHYQAQKISFSQDLPELQRTSHRIHETCHPGDLSKWKTWSQRSRWTKTDKEDISGKNSVHQYAAVPVKAFRSAEHVAGDKRKGSDSSSVFDLIVTQSWYWITHFKE